jgi:hypothetical protein
MQDIYVLYTIPDDTSEVLSNEIGLEFQYVARMFLFCQPSVRMPNLPTLGFNFTTSSIDKSNVIGCVIKYDAEKHRGLSKEKRYLNIMNLIEEGIKPYASQFGHDLSCFEKTISRMRAMGFKGSGFLLDPVKTSRDRKYKATMEIEMYENKHLFNIAFLDKEGRIVKRVPAHSYEFDRPLGNLCPLFQKIGRWRWLSNEEFVLSSRRATKNWIASPYRDGCVYREGGDYNKGYSPWGPHSHIVVWDEFWKMKGIE